MRLLSKGTQTVSVQWERIWDSLLGVHEKQPPGPVQISAASAVEFTSAIAMLASLTLASFTLALLTLASREATHTLLIGSQMAPAKR
jgi:hypothetical protein